MSAQAAQQKLRTLVSPDGIQAATRFFKTGPGEYSAGDVFIGVRTPLLRQVAREYQQLPFDEIKVLLRSPIHEERKLALLILVLNVTRGDAIQVKQIFDYYVEHLPHVNNWDLVDVSAPPIVGGYLMNMSRQPLYQWARSAALWERRIAIVATQHFIRHDDFDDTLKVSRLLLNDKHDLIHKAAGWMLREVGQRDEPMLKAFLDQHGADMPRTMLRYAIERFSSEQRKRYLARGSA